MPRYCLRKDLGFWRLRFRGREAVFKHEKGASYVAYLLVNAPEEPIHALDLAARLSVPDRKNPGIAELVDPATGRVVPLPSDARIEERGLALEDAQTMREVLRTEEQLEALLEDEDQVEPVRREAERELIALYDYETKHTRTIRDNAQKATDAVGRAISRLQGHLAEAVGASGEPNLVLRSFAEHLRERLLLPSGRGGKPGGGRRTRMRGCFIYLPPAGVAWKA